jgi:hypothetical protein
MESVRLSLWSSPLTAPGRPGHKAMSVALGLYVLNPGAPALLPPEGNVLGTTAPG